MSYFIGIDGGGTFTDCTAMDEHGLGTRPSFNERAAKDIPLGRLGYPAEMAEAVVWLCADSASFFTGQCLPIDGGMSVR